MFFRILRDDSSSTSSVVNTKNVCRKLTFENCTDDKSCHVNKLVISTKLNQKSKNIDINDAEDQVVHGTPSFIESSKEKG